VRVYPVKVDARLIFLTLMLPHAMWTGATYAEARCIADFNRDSSARGFRALLGSNVSFSCYCACSFLSGTHVGACWRMLLPSSLGACSCPVLSSCLSPLPAHLLALAACSSLHSLLSLP
jgi:hypothetical protein